MTPAELDRLERERLEADRAYNGALTELDQVILRKLPEIPHPPPPHDEHQITPLNELWQIVPGEAPPLGTGWRARLRGFVWRFLGPIFQQQQRFNAALVDHLNRNVPVARETKKAFDSITTLLREQLAALVTFETLLMHWAQHITAYIDTKDREGVERLRLALATGLDRLQTQVTTGLDAVADELRMRWESMVARERRYQARVDEVRTALAAVQQATATLKRELERLVEASAQPARASSTSLLPGRSAMSGTPAETFVHTSPFDAYKYALFEDKFRGPSEEIRARLVDYVDEFDGASEVLDVGCGRGEFLELLRERGISARGVDVNHEMVERCRARGLDVVESDALAYLESLPDASLGGLFGAQVVEHLEPGYLLRFLETAYHKLRPGSKIVLETINPTCWYAFFESYIRDLTHARPLHPDTLVYLLVASGFQQPEVRYRAPFPEASKLQPLELPSRVAGEAGNMGTEVGEALGRLAAVVNENVRKLNSLLFTYLDYAAIAVRA